MEQQGIDSGNLKKLTHMQLEQMIIHYKSELSQYKNKIKDYEEDFHYSQLKKLKIDNSKLKADLQESFKKITSIQEENLLLQTKITELEIEIETSETKYRELSDWYEEELNITSHELKRMKDFYEQEIDKRNERMEKQLKKSEKQKLLQKQLEGFINTLTEEINRPWKTPMNTNEEAENKNDFKIKHLQKELEKEIKNLDTLKKDMQAKITELAFLQMSGEVNKFQDHINMLVHQISGYGEDIAKVSQKVNQLKNEIEHNK